jgi:hypothetical protein
MNLTNRPCFPGLLLLALLATFASVTVSMAPHSQTAEKPKLRWYKGNTHRHTLNNDGDSTPDDVVRWYWENGYNSLVLTDHNFLTSVDGLNSLHAADEKFIVIKGEEVTDVFAGKSIQGRLDPTRVAQTAARAFPNLGSALVALLISRAKIRSIKSHEIQHHSC